MRASFVLVALAAVASASSIGKRQIPTCAITCMSKGDMGGCSSTDNTCLCKNPTFINQVTSCIPQECKGDDIETSNTAARALCLAAGVTLTSTAPAATGSSTATSSASPTPSNNAAINLSGSPMIGALAAMAGVVFAL